MQDFKFMPGLVGEVFAPTGKGIIFRLTMTLSLFFGWDVHHLDVKTAFLYAPISEEVYLKSMPWDTAPPG
jgi:hypothetical protein